MYNVSECHSKVEGILGHTAPAALKSKLELFYAYTMESEKNTAIDLNQLKDMVPESLVT